MVFISGSSLYHPGMKKIRLGSVFCFLLFFGKDVGNFFHTNPLR